MTAWSIELSFTAPIKICSDRWFSKLLWIDWKDWHKERVDRELTEIMRKAYAAVSEVAGEHAIDMRTAAFVLAIRRVGEAAKARTYTEEDIQL